MKTNYNNYNTTLTIASGQTESPALDLQALAARQPLMINILAPATLPESVNLRIAPTAGGVYRTQQSDGVDIALAQSKATMVTQIVAGGMKLVAGGAVAANRTFDIIINVYG